jgi:hypothetical protein
VQNSQPAATEDTAGTEPTDLLMSLSVSPLSDPTAHKADGPASEELARDS